MMTTNEGDKQNDKDDDTANATSHGSAKTDDESKQEKDNLAEKKAEAGDGDKDESNEKGDESTPSSSPMEEEEEEEKQATTRASEQTNRDKPEASNRTAVDDGEATTKEGKARDAAEKTTTASTAMTAATTAADGNKDEDDGIKTEPKGPYEKLRWTIVENDGTPRNLIKLVALKTLFSRQLPKMPRTYIARLVFDRRHTSLAILSDDPSLKGTDDEVIGAICFRAFNEMRFAEIAFCAVNASHQVKGYGTKLMNLLKNEAIVRGIEYFITYADNYAIGYFKKQGFTKAIAMPKSRYTGLIKDYDGGTMMECYVHPSIDYTRVPEMIAAQRKFIIDRIRLRANSHKVYPPLPKDFQPRLDGSSRGNESAALAMAIPGMAEAGWTLQDLVSSTGQGKEADRAKNALKSELLAVIRKIDEQQFAWPFRQPVDTTEVKDYLEVVKTPMDLSTIEKMIRKGDHYKSKQMLYADLMLMVNNCKLYNDEKSTYVSCAMSLEKFIMPLSLK